MTLHGHLDLPIELETIRPSIESSILPLYKLLPYTSKTSIVDCKFSGQPYLPLNYSYPKDVNGVTMRLLAQINFSQIKSEEPFPKDGILQFFISPSLYQTSHYIEEHLFQHYFKVRFFSKVSPTNQLTREFDFIDYSDDDKFPISQDMAMAFTKVWEPVSAMDYRVEKYFNQPLSNYLVQTRDGRPIEDIYLELFLGADHKIGGYPYFIHDDPRKNSHFLRRFDTLLLQIVSNDQQGIMWGDSGVIKFFINQQKLLNLDFSDIYFTAEQYE